MPHDDDHMMYKVGLGRLEMEDERDHDYPMSEILEEDRVKTAKDEEDYQYWWQSGWWGNQEKTPHCFPPGTMITMADGSEKPIEEIEEGDSVITHEGCKKEVTETMARDYKGDLYEIDVRGRKSSIEVTPEHPFLATEFSPTEVVDEADQDAKKSLGWSTEKRICLVCDEEARTREVSTGTQWHVYCSDSCKKEAYNKRRRDRNRSVVLKPEEPDWVRAEDLDEKVKNGSGDYLHFPKFSPDGEINSLEVDDILSNRKLAYSPEGEVKLKNGHTFIPREIPVTPELGRLVGLYLAEGSARKNRNGQIRFCFGYDERDTLASETVRLLDRIFNCESVIKLDKENSRANVVGRKSSALSALFEALCGVGCSNKRLHDLIWRWPEEVKKEVWKGFLDGDGCRQPDKNRHTLVTVSEDLARDLWRLGNQLGYAPTITYSDPKPSHNVESRRRRYDITRYLNRDQTNRPEDDEFVYCVVENTKTKQYSGKVYNLEVEEDHSYIAANVVVHNCVSYAWDHWLEDGPDTHFYEDRDADPEWMDPDGEELVKAENLYKYCQRNDQWPGECVDMETESLSKSKGWVNSEELEVGDEILTFNMDTETTEWAEIEKVHEYKNRPYRVWGNRNFEAAVTDNHKWPVNSRVNGGSYDLVETQNWKSQHQFPKAAFCSDLPDSSEWNDSFVKLVAWVMTEGYYRPDSRKGWGICLSQKGEHVDHIQNLLHENGCDVKGYEDDNGCHGWEISGELAKEIRKVAPERKPKTEWLMSLTENQINLFIDEAIKGDGHVHKCSGNRQKRTTYAQKSGPLLDSFITACSLAGRPVSRSSTGKRSNNNVENWTLTHSNRVRVRKLNELEKKKGDVWCPQTRNGTFVARRNGSVFITGNSYRGTSVRAGAKVLKREGLIKEYRWAWDAQTVVDVILTKGPVVVGTRWYEDMFYPDSEGIIEKSGPEMGGHAYVLNGVNLNKGLFRLKNSWGRDWGKNGYAYISIEDMDELIKDRGEACIGVEEEYEDYEEEKGLD